jgi:hypothetical protein
MFGVRYRWPFKAEDIARRSLITLTRSYLAPRGDPLKDKTHRITSII